VLATAAQPLQTDDMWWHLALGRAYAGDGPWLADDPLLHTAAGPPDPAAWLSDLGLHLVGSFGGFPALRIAHALLVATILGLCWSLLHRASGSRGAASLLASAFAALSAYRLFQLRPELLTILATLLLYRLVLERPRAPTRTRAALTVALLALWANAHNGFLLGPILLASAAGGLLVAAAIAPAGARARDRARIAGLLGILAVGLCATLLNPSGVAPYLAWFRAGVETPDLALVSDEWSRLDLFRAPVANLPPSPLAWALAWMLFLFTIPVAIRTVLRWRRSDSHDAAADPPLVAIASCSLVAMLVAVRFLWLGIFPLLLLAREGSAWLASRPLPRLVRSLAVGISAGLLLFAFIRLGDWRMISGMLPDSLPGWAQPFPPAKYEAQATWILADAGVEGRLVNEYFQGGFLGYWLAPRLREFVNGSLNFPKHAFAAYGALRDRQGLDGERFLEVLDRYEVDVFLGVGLPQPARPNRPRIYSSGHLERTPGWIPIFRELRSAAYLRANERNRENLARIADYYRREGVPFDPERGFDPAAVIREAPAWAAAHGLVPGDLASIEADAISDDPRRKRWALDRLAALWVALGRYEDAIALDQRLLRANPGASAPARRLLWSLLRVGRYQEAGELAQKLAHSQTSSLVAAIASVALRAQTADPDEIAELLARLPVITRSEAAGIVAGTTPPEARPWRR
jgi:tetratricopeptide (TPR) repeat protein